MRCIIPTVFEKAQDNATITIKAFLFDKLNFKKLVDIGITYKQLLAICT